MPLANNSFAAENKTPYKWLCNSSGDEAGVGIIWAARVGLSLRAVGRDITAIADCLEDRRPLVK